MTPPAVPAPASPFRGIEEFRFFDRAIFPSRAVEVRRLLRLITLYRGVLLYGDSGVGKSSLINAGLIPRAIAEGFAPERLRVDPRPGAEIIVERISQTESGEPPYLPSRFARDEKQRRITLSIEEFLKKIRQIERRPAPRPLLIFDQFEELLTLAEQPRAKGRDRVRTTVAAQDGIIHTLLDILGDEEIPVKILFVFREDFLAKLSKIFSRHPNLNDQYLRLDPLSVTELPTIVRTPFEQVSFEKELSPDLARRLKDEFQKRGDTDVLNLSEVQIAALRLWESSDPVKLLAEGGVGGLIEGYFSEAIGRLGDLQQPAVLLLTRMVTYSDTRNVVSRDDLLRAVSTDERIAQGKLDKALKALEKGRVIRGEKRSNVVVYEIVSEYLVPWIVKQRTELAAEKLRKVSIEQANAAYREMLEEREQKRWKRTVRIYQSIVVVAALIIIGAFIYNQRTTNAKTREELKISRAAEKRLLAEKEALTTELEQFRAELTEEKAARAALNREKDGLSGSLATMTTLTDEAKRTNGDLIKRVQGLQNELDRCRSAPPATTTAPVTATSTQ